MPGETISPGELEAMYTYAAPAKKWSEKYHVTSVSKTAIGENGQLQWDNLMSTGKSILLSSDVKDTGHKDRVLLGMLWDDYYAIKEHARKRGHEKELDAEIPEGMTLSVEKQDTVGIEILEKMPHEEVEAPPVEASEE